MTLKRRLTSDYGFDLSLAYTDADGDLITLASQNDLRELLDTGLAAANVRVLPVLARRGSLADESRRRRGWIVRGGESRRRPAAPRRG